MTCGPAAKVNALVDRYDELQVGEVLYQPSGAWRLLFVRIGHLPEEPASFTMVDLYPGGGACLIAVGQWVPGWLVDAVIGRGEA